MHLLVIIIRGFGTQITLFLRIIVNQKACRNRRTTKSLIILVVKINTEDKEMEISASTKQKQKFFANTPIK